MLKIAFAIIGLSLSLPNSAISQYISSISYPDSTKITILDENELCVKYSNHINKTDIKSHIFTLASDEFEGRETGKLGNLKAAKYIAKQFEKLGLPKIGDEPYFQNVAFTFSKWEKTVMYVNGTKYKHLWEYISFPNQNQNLGEIKADEIIFLGYGIDHPNYSDYSGVDLKDKIIMVYKGEPTDTKGKSKITGKNTPSFWSNNFEIKTIAAKNHGAKLVLFIEDDIKKLAMENRKSLLGQQVDLGNLLKRNENKSNNAFISTNIFEALLGDQRDEVIAARNSININGKPKLVNLKTDFRLVMDKSARMLEGQNVLGYIEGSDLKDQVVVISAHYDHIGMRGDDIYNGADDNGSGTVTVLEIAQALKESKTKGEGPRRSVLCLLVTGEEKGLLGSAYYADNPVFPLEKTVADVNIDMVGRYDNKYAQDSSNYIYVIGSDRLSTELHTINEQINQDYSQLIMDYTYNSQDDPNRYYYRSDHYNFAEKGIPAIFFFSGVHDDYHRPTDTPDKIDLDKMEKVGRHIFKLVWRLANQDKRIAVDVHSNN